MVFVTALIWLHTFQYRTLHFWMREDGPFEYATFACYLVAGVLFLLHARHHGAWNHWSLAYAILFLAVAGEEISWGQRIFGFRVPSYEAFNTQQETTIHNLRGMHTTSRMIGVLVVGVICFGLPLFARISGLARSAMRRTGMPLFPTAATPVVIASFGLMAGQRVFGHQFRTYDESGEFLISVAMLSFACNPVMMDRHPAWSDERMRMKAGTGRKHHRKAGVLSSSRSNALTPMGPRE